MSGLIDDVKLFALCLASFVIGFVVTFWILEKMT